jgi:S-adenosylmethionine:tRNA ribosyltransferase-isomerase
MKTSDFDYYLPKELIAQKPFFPRDKCRLLVLERETGQIEHHYFFEIEKFLKAGDVLVLNNSKVFKARLYGEIRDNNSQTKKQVEIFLLRPVASNVFKKKEGRKKGNLWEVLGKPGKKLEKGVNIWFTKHVFGKVKEKTNGTFLVQFNLPRKKFITFVNRFGHIPVPPYIKKEPSRLSDYQTIYAKKIGSVAAPTAGFHFTRSLLNRLRKKGVKIVFLTLQVGYGTFQPIRSENIEEHRIKPELVEIPKKTSKIINQAKKEGKRVIAVGTTVVRALEGAFLQEKKQGKEEKLLKKDFQRLSQSAVHNSELLLPYTGEVDLFIYPGFKFKIVDALITNFHLPKSTLLVLVSAFAGRDLIRKAYQEAIRKKYRFYSFGDAMLIL